MNSVKRKVRVKEKPIGKDELCDFCGGKLSSKVTDIELKRRGRWVIIEDVPAEVCSRCGEKYLSAEVAEKIDRLLQGKPHVEKTITVPVMRWGAAAGIRE